MLARIERAWGRVKSRRGLVIAGMALVLVTPAARGQPVQGDIKSIGFEAKTQSRYVIRYGQWFPVLAALTVPGTQHFQGSLIFEQVDLDGDRVAYTRSPVAITAGGGEDRAWVYATAVKEGIARAAQLEIIDNSNIQVNALPAPLYEPVGNDTRLILDISSSPVTGLQALDSGGGSYSDLQLGHRPYYRPVCIASLPARSLPDAWFGLEAVDTIVWDEPDPDALSNDQLRALLSWVRRGGKLVLGIGPSWSKLSKSALREILPLTGDQPPVETQGLPTFTRTYALSADSQFKSPLSVATAGLAAGAVAPLADRLDDGRVVQLISLRAAGSGSVTALAARLRDLATMNLRTAFYESLLNLTSNTEAFMRRENEKAFALTTVNLYPHVVEPTEFRRLASVRVGAAYVFVGGYIALATMSFFYLKKRQRAALSWTVFAAFAVVGSAASLGAVSLLRGVTTSVASASVVDVEAGSNEARAHVWFGYKSPTRERVSLALPGEENYLRALTSGPGVMNFYATAERYTASPTDARLDDALIRATLKQFEGAWRGKLDGSVRAQLAADRSSGRISGDSWVKNDLPVELLGGYLLYIDPRLRDPVRGDDVPMRAAGLNTRSDRSDGRYLGVRTVPPAVNVLAVSLGPMKAGARLVQLGKAEYDRYDMEYQSWSRAQAPDAKNEPMLHTLWYYQNQDWGYSLSSTVASLVSRTDPHQAALALCSTHNLLLHNGSAGAFDDVDRPLSTDGLPDLDVTHWLTRGQAVLLLFSDQPGPAVLHAGGVAVEARSGRALYRVRVPLAYTGQSPPPRVSPPGAGLEGEESGEPDAGEAQP